MTRTIICLILILVLPAFSFAQAESDIVITEIFYNQPGPDTLEFIELHNKGDQNINLENYAFTRGIYLKFPSYDLAPGAYVVISRYPQFTDVFFNIISIPWDSGALDNSGERLVLKDPFGNIADSVEYSDQFPWPEEADGQGPSLELCDVDADNSKYEFWNTSTTFAGFHLGQHRIFASPGRPNSGCYPIGDRIPPEITDVVATDASTVIISFSEPVLNADLLNRYRGLQIKSIIYDAEAYTATISLQQALQFARPITFDAEGIEDIAGNEMPRTTFHLGYNDTRPSLVITEIHYDQPGSDDLEYIEILYSGKEPAQLGGIRFDRGIRYVFPEMTVQPNTFIILAENAENVNHFFNLQNTMQWHSGGLSNVGERLRIVNSLQEQISLVEYSPLAPWPIQGAATGPSIILCDVAGDNNDPSNWSYSRRFVGYKDDQAIFGSPGMEETCDATALQSHRDLLNIIYGPNPNSGTLLITSSEPGLHALEITDLAGRSLFNIDFDQSLFINLPEIIQGLVLIKATNNDTGHLSINKLYIQR